MPYIFKDISDNSKLVCSDLSIKFHYQGIILRIAATSNQIFSFSVETFNLGSANMLGFLGRRLLFGIVV